MRLPSTSRAGRSRPRFGPSTRLRRCPKALVRSRLWSADAQIARSELPSPGEMIAALSKGAVDGAEYDAAYPQRLKETIY